ncbi:P-loop containing nucleoside triphosphate hydrolase protein [Obba rivulosa]|uniref:RNA helicase n=1 Tax=Obba rivulosa TaxID=1052685 RepID=A0A8E2AGE9_9APHY|nr:P-loop containing nucleoside triphosphate hydrolase protein [Obba rivulosa]
MLDHLTSICPDLLYDGVCNVDQCPKRHDAKLCDICNVICVPDSSFDAHLRSAHHQANFAALEATKSLKCTLCNIIVTGRAPWNQHISGAAHRKTATAKGVSPQTEPVDPTTPSGHKRCSLCKRNIISNQWSSHLRGQDHRKREMVAGYKALYEQAQLDKNSVTVTPAEVHFGIVDMARSREGVTAKLILSTDNATSRIRIVSVKAYTTSNKSISPFSMNLPAGSASSVLTHAKRITLPVQFQHDQLGNYEGHVEISFEDAVKRRFIIVRQVKAIVGDTADHELLKARIPYKGRVRVPWRKGQMLLPGRRPPALDAVPWVKKLPAAPIPDFLSTILTTQPEDTAKATLCTSRIPETLDHQNHGKFFKLLLWTEEFRAERDLRLYDMADVQFKKEGQYYTLVVPGLAEKRPSVVVGDRIEAQAANSTTQRCFEGYVHVVRLEDVCLCFNPSFKPGSGQRFNIRFKLNRVPFRRQHEALAATGSALKTVLFPEVTEASTRQVSKSAPSTLYNPLLKNNPEQLHAVNCIKQLEPGTAPYIVFGPPGTGKTSTIVEAILQVLAQDTRARILACAPSNSAADEILGRLKTRLDKKVMFRFNAVTRDRTTIPEGLLQYSYTNPQGVFSVPSITRLSEFKVIVSTCVSAAFAYGIGLQPGHFTHIFVDEAAQATEAEVMAAVKRMVTTSTRIILSGDPLQLGPIIRSDIARDLGLGKSYLERLMERPVYNDSVAKKTIIKLLKNYRSHKAILDFPNERFYGQELQPCGSPPVINAFLGSPVLANKKFPVVFHAITSMDNREASSPSYFNASQVSLVKDYVARLLEQGTKATDIGVITPYNAQAKKIRKKLEHIAGDSTVGTVEMFQGQERRVIIVSTVRSTRELLAHDIKHALGFVANPRRFNVAVTRAQALLVVIGDPLVLSLDPLWRAFMNYVFNNGGWKGDAPGWDTRAPVDDSGDYVQSVLQAAVQDMDEFARRMEQLVLEGMEADGAEANEDRPWREVE